MIVEGEGCGIEKNVFFLCNFAHFYHWFVYCLLTDDVTNTISNPPVDKSKGIETYSAAESKWFT